MRRLVAEAINENKLAVLDEIRSERLAAELRGWFLSFRVGFPGWRQEILQLVVEGSVVAARCTSGDEPRNLARGARYRASDADGRGLVLHRG